MFSWAVYSAIALWMTVGVQYQLGDAMARVADARYMLFSRDPHLAAVGMYWMPMPVMGQLPFMLVLSPLHRAELSGPLGSAFAGAVAVLVLTRICRLLEFSRPVAIGFTLVYALNPVIMLNSGNGMSEEWSFLGCLIVLLGYVGWCKNHRSADLATLAAGLVFVMLTRYEALLLGPIMGLAAALNDRSNVRFGDNHNLRGVVATVKGRLPRWTRIFGIVVAPTYYIFALWTLLQYVIMRDPFYWVKQQRLSGHTSSGYINLPSHLTVTTIVVFALQTTLVICPALVIVGPLLLLRRRGGRVAPGLGIIAGAFIWPAIVVAGLVTRSSAGTTRYFEPPIIFVTVGAMWLAANFELPSIRGRPVTAAVLIGVLIVSAVSGMTALENRRRSSIEREDFLVGSFLGRPVEPLRRGDTAVAIDDWTAVARDLDPRLARGSKVLIDATVDFQAFVFSHHPGNYIVDSDRDYLQILSDPVGKFDYLIQSTNTLNVGPRSAAINGLIADTSHGHWELWRTYPPARVYHLVPNQAGPK